MVAATTGIGSGIIAYPDLVSQDINTTNPHSFVMYANGSITHSEDSTGSLKWVVNTAPTNYEVSNNGGSWLDFSANRSMAAGTIDLRDKYTTSTVKSVTVTFS